MKVHSATTKPAMVRSTNSASKGKPSSRSTALATAAASSGSVPVVATAPSANSKRERILDAAEIIFAAHGFFAARVSQIADQAGVADGTIYLYFKSKDDILISWFESRMDRLISALNVEIAGLSPRAQLHAFVTCYLTSVQAEPAAAEVMTVELRQSSKFMHDYENPRFVDFFRILVGIISAGQASKAFTSAIPAPMIARMIFGMLDELSTSWVLAQDRPLAPAKRDKSPQVDRSNSANKGVRTGSHRPKKFDIIRAAEWVNTLVENGIAAT
jgi:TetR/AcrR family transcriptional regulator, fatty acid metabolism regulator protein